MWLVLAKNALVVVVAEAEAVVAAVVAVTKVVVVAGVVVVATVTDSLQFSRCAEWIFGTDQVV
jgi:hypothetical protein